MVGNADLSGKNSEIADRHAARYADLRNNQAMPADRTVVSDLHEIVDLGALANHGVAGGAAVDRGIGADLDVILDDHAAGLRNLLMAARRRQETESVLSDAGPGMNDDAVADQGVKDGGLRADCAVAADANAGPNHRAWPNERGRSDLGARADHRERIDDHAGFEARRGIDLRAGRAPNRAEQRRRTKQVVE